MTDDDRDLLAAELALGLLDGDELTRAQGLCNHDLELRERAAVWRGTFAELASQVAPVSPPAYVWHKIERVLGMSAANDNPSQMRRTLAAWRMAALTATAVAAVLALALFVQPISDAAAPQQRGGGMPLVATLGANGETLQSLAAWDPSSAKLFIAPDNDLRLGTRQSHELWIIPKGKQPRSLGTLTSAPAFLTIAPDLASEFDANSTLAISLEPAGGSKTGQPTGPILASGPLQAL